MSTLSYCPYTVLNMHTAYGLIIHSSTVSESRNQFHTFTQFYPIYIWFHILTQTPNIHTVHPCEGFERMNCIRVHACARERYACTQLSTFANVPAHLRHITWCSVAGICCVYGIGNDWCHTLAQLHTCHMSCTWKRGKAGSLLHTHTCTYATKCTCMHAYTHIIIRAPRTSHAHQRRISAPDQKSYASSAQRSLPPVDVWPIVF